MRGYDHLQGPENSGKPLLALLLSNGSYLGNKDFKVQCVRNCIVLIPIKCILTVMPCSQEVFCIGRYVTYLYSIYTGCNRRNGPDFGRVFLMLNYTEKPQNTYIQS